MKISKSRPKTKYIAFVAASVDGKISLTKNTTPDWTSPEDWQFLQKSLANIDAVVVGRNTYTAAATRLRRRTTFVLSSRVSSPKKRGSVTFINPANTNLELMLNKYKTIAVLGGGTVYGYMIENDLLDEIYISIEPLILGRGKDMFIGGRKTTKLELLSVKKINRQGTILLRYSIKKYVNQTHKNKNFPRRRRPVHFH